MNPEAELVRAARAGDRDAIARLVETHSPRLHRYLAHLTNDATLAEDLLQDTWLRVMERLDRFDPKYPFPVWLFTVARNVAIDELRRRGRRERPMDIRPDEDGAAADPIERVADPGPSLLQQISDRDLQEKVGRLIASLPTDFREVLSLRFREELRPDEIARVLGLPSSTIKTRLYRGLELLRRRAERFK